MLSPLYPVAFKKQSTSILCCGYGYLYRTRTRTRNKCTLHDQIDAQGIYVILRAQKRAFNREEALKERGVYFHFWNPKTNDER